MLTITCTRTAKNAARPSLCFLLPVMWSVSRETRLVFTDLMKRKSRARTISRGRTQGAVAWLLALSMAVTIPGPSGLAADSESPFTNAVWIGAPKAAETRPTKNIHHVFRHKLTLEDKSSTAPIRVTGDARYILWVNGIYVGRGPARCYPSRQAYDEYDLAPFLRKGTNWITAQVHEFCFSNGQHIYSGKHGLILEGQV